MRHGWLPKACLERWKTGISAVAYADESGTRFRSLRCICCYQLSALSTVAIAAQKRTLLPALASWSDNVSGCVMYLDSTATALGLTFGNSPQLAMDIIRDDLGKGNHDWLL